jgi:hypothetical protein
VVNFVQYCVLYFAYCAVVMTEYFDAMEVCCEAVKVSVLNLWCGILGAHSGEDSLCGLS